jgi:hypothetical protein
MWVTLDSKAEILDLEGYRVIARKFDEISIE